MGYLGNQLATVVCAAFAAVLTALWYVMVPAFPVLEFVFIMAVPIMWFLVLMCWLAQKSADYVHAHGEKKSLNNRHVPAAAPQAPGGGAMPAGVIRDARTELEGELDKLRGTIQLKDTEIGRLRREIANMQTLVQIESLKSELANLKMLARERS